VKRVYGIIVLSAIAALLGCSTAAITYTSEIPDLKPALKKALVVIIRPAPEKGAMYHSDKLSAIFVDDKFGAVTSANTMVTMQADTGVHYVISKIDNVSIVKLTFSANKAYYFIQKVSPMSVAAPTKGGVKPTGGLTRVNTFLDPVSPDEYMDVMKKAGGAIRYARYDANKPMKNLDPRDLKHYTNGYEYWAKTVPDQAKKHLEYPGY
jgi:hypothetical protein